MVSWRVLTNFLYAVHLLPRMVKSFKAFKLKFINVADFLKKKKTQTISCTQFVSLEKQNHLRLVLSFESQIEEITFFLIRTFLNQNFKNKVRTISQLNSFYFAQFLFIRVANNFNTRQNHRSHLKSDVSSRQLTSYGKENLLTPERTFAVTNRKKHINNITKFF